MIRNEFPDGIKNSILSRPKSFRKDPKTTNQSYEKLARDSNIDGPEVDEENLEERKIGDVISERGKDLRYDIDAIIENSICPKFDRQETYNWYTARIYSVIDIIGHPMHQLAKLVLEKHLERLQKIEAEQQDQMIDDDTDSDNSEIYNEEEEEESEDEELNEEFKNLKEGEMKSIPKPAPTSSAATSGPFKYGDNVPTKEQILEQYNSMVEFRTNQFHEMEKNIKDNAELQNFMIQKKEFFEKMEKQKNEMLEQINPPLGDEHFHGQGEIDDAFKIEEEGEYEEEEEESEEEPNEEVNEKKKKVDLRRVTEQSKEDSDESEENKEKIEMVKVDEKVQEIVEDDDFVEKLVEEDMVVNEAPIIEGVAKIEELTVEKDENPGEKITEKLIDFEDDGIEENKQHEKIEEKEEANENKEIVKEEKEDKAKEAEGEEEIDDLEIGEGEDKKDE